MFQERLMADIKKFVNSPFAKSLSKQFVTYEGKVKKLMHEFDIKSQPARVRGRKQIDKFTKQLRKTRTEIEKKVSSLVNREVQDLNGRITDLVRYLKAVALKETPSSSQKGRKSKCAPGARKTAVKMGKKKLNVDMCGKQTGPVVSSVTQGVVDTATFPN